MGNIAVNLLGDLWRRLRSRVGMLQTVKDAIVMGGSISYAFGGKKKITYFTIPSIIPCAI